MTNHDFTQDEVEELLGNDLSLAYSISSLLNDGGDVYTFLTQKLLERRKELEEYERSQEEVRTNEDWKDWNSLQNAVDAGETRYINQTYWD